MRDVCSMILNVGRIRGSFDRNLLLTRLPLLSFREHFRGLLCLLFGLLSRSSNLKLVLLCTKDGQMYPKAYYAYHILS